MTTDPTAELPRAFGPVPVAARIRSSPDDFHVEELTAVRPTGHGEHLLVRLRKRGANTEWVARCLARQAGVKPRDVGFAGLKDRHAVTEQWFSIHVPGREIDPGALGGDEFQVLECIRHTRKIRRGALRGNRFRIVLRGVRGPRDALEERLHRIAEQGAPNYFGSQRFGRDGANLLLGTHRSRVPGIRLSAYRAHLFNQVLGARVRRRDWDRVVAGDWLSLDGTQRIFMVTAHDPELDERAARMDVHPTGALWGKGSLPTEGTVAELETEVAKRLQDYVDVLERHGLKQERRPLRMRVQGPEWCWEETDKLILSFTLPRGSYATAVLRELIREIPKQP